MEKNNVYKGKLGFDGTLTNALSRATPIVIDTFEDHGHDVHTFVSRSASAVSMDLDQFTVELRHRPRMKRGWKAPQCDGDMLELRILPLFPEVCDREITEMLLAAIMHNVVNELDVVSVKWLDAPTLLTRHQFLSAFEGVDLTTLDAKLDAQVPDTVTETSPALYSDVDDFTYWETDTPLALVEPKPTSVSFPDSLSRPRGRAVFKPVDVTARELVDHCDEILMANHVEPEPSLRDTRPESQVGTRLRRLPSQLWALAALPVLKAVDGLSFLRQRELRQSLQLLFLIAAAFYLHSAGMVRAAINLLN